MKKSNLLLPLVLALLFPLPIWGETKKKEKQELLTLQAKKITLLQICKKIQKQSSEFNFVFPAALTAEKQQGGGLSPLGPSGKKKDSLPTHISLEVNKKPLFQVVGIILEKFHLAAELYPGPLYRIYRPKKKSQRGIILKVWPHKKREKKLDPSQLTTTASLNFSLESVVNSLCHIRGLKIKEKGKKVYPYTRHFLKKHFSGQGKKKGKGSQQTQVIITTPPGLLSSQDFFYLYAKKIYWKDLLEALFYAYGPYELKKVKKRIYKIVKVKKPGGKEN